MSWVEYGPSSTSHRRATWRRATSTEPGSLLSSSTITSAAPSSNCHASSPRAACVPNLANLPDNDKHAPTRNRCNLQILRVLVAGHQHLVTELVAIRGGHSVLHL